MGTENHGSYPDSRVAFVMRQPFFFVIHGSLDIKMIDDRKNSMTKEDLSQQHPDTLTSNTSFSDDSPPEDRITPEEKDVSAWQAKLLPVMVFMVLGLTVFFFAASLYQLFSLQNRISQSPNLDLSPVLAHATEDNPLAGKEMLETQRWKTLTLLEEHAVRQRYHQANVLLMARVWVRYLGFVTGMTLALVGAVFVLGKLREQQTELSMKGQSGSGALSTSSPGLVLCTLGTVLMLATLLTHNSIDVKDGPLYVVLPYASSQTQKAKIEKPADVSKLPGSGSPHETENPDKQTDLKPKSTKDNEDMEEFLRTIIPGEN